VAQRPLFSHPTHTCALRIAMTSSIDNLHSNITQAI
jgi:hypothetical protein